MYPRNSLPVEKSAYISHDIFLQCRFQSYIIIHSLLGLILLKICSNTKLYLNCVTITIYRSAV